MNTRTAIARIRLQHCDDRERQHFCALRSHFAWRFFLCDDNARTRATTGRDALRETKTCSMLLACARIPLDVLLSTRNINTNSRGKVVDEKVNDT
jgi:hypothetical protein